MEHFMGFDICTNEVPYELNDFLQRDTMKLSDIQSEYSRNTKSNRSQVKLPPHVVNVFDGYVTQWKSFYDKFNAAVHSGDLSSIEKFSYEDALKVISGLALTSENYRIALNFSEQLSGNETLIISSHMMALNKLPFITSDEDLTGLMIFRKSVSGLY